LIGDPVRFLFVYVTRLVYLEFGLQTQSLLFAACLTLAARYRVVAAGAFALKKAAGKRCDGWILLLYLSGGVATHVPIPP
jgi:hypothetical protein